MRQTLLTLILLAPCLAGAQARERHGSHALGSGPGAPPRTEVHATTQGPITTSLQPYGDPDSHAVGDPSAIVMRRSLSDAGASPPDSLDAGGVRAGPGGWPENFLHLFDAGLPSLREPNLPRSSQLHMLTPIEAAQAQDGIGTFRVIVPFGRALVLPDVEHRHARAVLQAASSTQTPDATARDTSRGVPRGMPADRQAEPLLASLVPSAGGALRQPGSLQAARVEAPSGYPVSVGQSFQDCAECPKLVVIPAGSFMMGSPRSERGRDPTEGPQREVVLHHPLAVGKYEVTFDEWDACGLAGWCTYRPDSAGWGRGRLPVMRVSWEDAQQYVNWLSRRTGKTYRLLTEAEWEYAARAGSATPYSFGQTISPSLANYGDHVGRTQLVGSFPANGFGLHDMHGNLLEWVQDCWRTSYAGAPNVASQAALTGGCTQRVIRGGAWGSAQQHLRAASRTGLAPTYRQYIVGFRVARMPSLP